MLKGFLNHGCIIVNVLLVGACTHVHTVSFPARLAGAHVYVVLPGTRRIYGNKKKLWPKN